MHWRQNDFAYVCRYLVVRIPGLCAHTHTLFTNHITGTCDSPHKYQADNPSASPPIPPAPPAPLVCLLYRSLFISCSPAYPVSISYLCFLIPSHSIIISPIFFLISQIMIWSQNWEGSAPHTLGRCHDFAMAARRISQSSISVIRVIRVIRFVRLRLLLGFLI